MNPENVLSTQNHWILFALMIILGIGFLTGVFAIAKSILPKMNLFGKTDYSTKSIFPWIFRPSKDLSDKKEKEEWITPHYIPNNDCMTGNIYIGKDSFTNTWTEFDPKKAVRVKNKKIQTT